MGPLARNRPGDWTRSSARPSTGSRADSDAVNRLLVRGWLGGRRLGRVLKTDLWDEAVADGVAPALADHADEVHGVDVAPLTVAAAARRHPWLHDGRGRCDALPRRTAPTTRSSRCPRSTTCRDGARWRMGCASCAGGASARRGSSLITFDNGREAPWSRCATPCPRVVRHATGLVPYPVEVALGRRSLVRVDGVVPASRSSRPPPRCTARGGGPSEPPRPQSAAPLVADRLARRLLAWEPAVGPSPARQVTGHFVVVQARRR